MALLSKTPQGQVDATVRQLDAVLLRRRAKALEVRDELSAIAPAIGVEHEPPDGNLLALRIVLDAAHMAHWLPGEGIGSPVHEVPSLRQMTRVHQQHATSIA